MPDGSPFPYSTDDVVIEPGTYRVPESAWSVADFSITFPEDWGVQYGHVFHTAVPERRAIELYAVVVDEIYADACDGETGGLADVGPSVDDLATALLRQPGPKASGPFETTLGGYPAVRIDLRIPDDLDLETCSFGRVGLQIWYSPPPADKYFVLLRDGSASVYIVDVDGERQVFMTQHRSATTDEDLRERQAILDSIRIEP